MCVKTQYLIDQLLNYGTQLLESFFDERNFFFIVIKHALFLCPIQVNNCFLLIRDFIDFRIRTAACQMILICDVVLGIV